MARSHSVVTRRPEGKQAQTSPGQDHTEQASVQRDGVSNTVPPGRFLGLWKQEIYSDVRIKLICASASAGTTYKTLWEKAATLVGWSKACTEAQVYREFPAHKAALAAGSNLKGLFTTGQDMAEEPAAKKARVEAQSATVAQIEPHVIDMSCESEDDADALESVLEFLYTHALPASATVKKLYKMMISAEYLGSDVCIQACAFGLSKMPLSEEYKTLRNIFQILERWPASASLEVIERLQTAYSDCLATKYRDVLTIINNNDLLNSFCKMPLDAIEAWGASDKVTVDKENSVVVLLNRWWHSQSDQMHTDECKAKLSGVVRTAFLSKGYLLYVLDRLEWFVEPFGYHKFACSALSEGSNDIDKRLKPFNKLVLRRRNYTYGPLKLTWRISLDEIQDAVSSTAPRHIMGPQGYCQGHVWSLCLQTTIADDGIVTLSLGVNKLAASLMPEGIPATAQIVIDEKPFQVLQSHNMFTDSQSWWVSEVLKDAIDALNDYGTRDGFLVVTVKISNVQ